MKTAIKLILIGCIILTAGCASWRGAEIYPMSYDQTYECVVSALDAMNPWMVTKTDQKRGLITIGYEEYIGRQESQTFIVERIEPFRTKVSLYRTPGTPFNQQFFKAIDRYMEERALTYPS